MGRNNFIKTLSGPRWACAVLLACALTACDATPPEDTLTDVSTLAAGSTLVGRFVFHATPLAAVPENRLRLERFEIAQALEEGPIGSRSAALVSVLSDVSLSGPGTWDPVAEELSATVRMTNLGSVDFDEPRMIVTWISDPTVVTFLDIHYGGGGVGSGYGYADIEAPPGANNSSAKQGFRAYDPGGLPFSFSVDVLAETTSPASAIFPDRDDDSYNIEPLSEPAGGDCDDTDPTANPAGATCGACIPDCSACGAGECCLDTCTSTCTTDCASHCDCSINGGPGAIVSTICKPDTTCTVACNESTSCDITRCQNGICDMTCTDGGSCELHDCQVSADCDLVCDGTNTCGITDCKNSSCDVVCTSVETCYLDCDNSKNNGSQCRLQCASDVTTCTLTCKKGDPIDCGGGAWVCPGTSC